MGTYLRETIRLTRMDAPVYLLIVLYALAGWIFLEHAGAIDRANYFLYANRWALQLFVVFPFAVLLADYCRVVIRFDTGRARAMRRVFSVKRISRLLSGTALIAGFMLFHGVFTSVKNGLSVWQGGFPYDRVQADIDAFLHFGIDPWRIIYGAVWNETLLAVINWNYAMMWFLIGFGGLMLVATSPRAERIRAHYILCFMLVWIVVGNVFAGLFMSAGPAFYGDVTGDVERFGRQLSMLAGAENPSAFYQLYLWRLHEAGETGLASGISAFPSVHVALAAMNAMFAWSLDRRLGMVAWAYVAVIQFSSVYLAWHYAIDGYAAIAITWAIYWCSGKIPRLIVQPALAPARPVLTAG